MNLDENKDFVPVEDFNISGKNGDKLYFYRGNLFQNETKDFLIYFLKDESSKEFKKQIEEKDLIGEEYPEVKACIIIDKKDKKFKFLVDRFYRKNGYGKAIYENCSQILDTLGIQDKEQYEILDSYQVNPTEIHTEELLSRIKSEASTENAIGILRDFAKYPNAVKLSDISAIVEYAIKSNVSVQEIAEALNENGFKVFKYIMPHCGAPWYNDVLMERDIEQFRSFKITGLKATCVHRHIMKNKSFEFLKLITDADKEDTTLEFKRVFEEIKKQREEREKEDRHIPYNLKQFGEFEHIILDWHYPELLFRDVTPEIREIVKGQAINNFEKFDPDHNSSELGYDGRTVSTYKFLSRAGLMDKNTYIALYQKALNRNYNLKEFDKSICRFIDKDERREAKEEILQNAYYPYPKKSWQKSHSWEEGHRISKVAIPQELIQRGEVRSRIKQEIIKQELARNTKIKTDMAGIGKDGKPFVVDNLKDWLFGVPGAHGNLQMMGTDGIAFPPQTPEFAINMVEQVLEDLTYPGVSGRGE